MRQVDIIVRHPVNLECFLLLKNKSSCWWYPDSVRNKPKIRQKMYQHFHGHIIWIIRVTFLLWTNTIYCFCGSVFSECQWKTQGSILFVDLQTFFLRYRLRKHQDICRKHRRQQNIENIKNQKTLKTSNHRKHQNIKNIKTSKRRKNVTT